MRTPPRQSRGITIWEPTPPATLNVVSYSWTTPAWQASFMLDGKPLLSTTNVWVWEKGAGGRVAQSLVHDLLLLMDVHTFEDGTDESLGRRLQWHTIAVTPNSLFFLRFYIILFYSIHVYVYILLFVINLLSLHLYLLLLVCQAAQLTHILEGWVRELAKMSSERGPWRTRRRLRARREQKLPRPQRKRPS